jgi:medium-chain acyl-[acyl-carrier-protein] hydrolase
VRHLGILKDITMITIGSYPFELKTYELDQRGRMPLGILYRNLQEAAERNAVDLGFGAETMIKKGLTWILARLQLRVTAFPEGRRTITAETWPAAVESRFAMRDFRFRYGDDQACFAVASSAWLLLDIAKQRPVTVAQHLDLEHVTNIERMVIEPFPTIQTDGEPMCVTEFRIRRSDLDINDHVNNLHYVEWLAESVPEDLWRRGNVRSMDVEYKRAVGYGATVRVDSFRVAGDIYDHRMVVAGAAGDVLRARTVWAE